MIRPIVREPLGNSISAAERQTGAALLQLAKQRSATGCTQAASAERNTAMVAVFSCEQQDRAYVIIGKHANLDIGTYANSQQIICQLAIRFGIIANMTRADLVDLIEAALVAKGMKPATASKAASGNPYLIRNMTRPDGQITVPNFENLQSICEVLDLEFYIGPPRGTVEPAHAQRPTIDTDILEIHPPKGRHWHVPNRDPGDLFFFKPTAHFRNGAQAIIMDRTMWGLAQRDIALRDNQYVVVQRASDGGLNIGWVRATPEPDTVFLEMTGRAEAKDWPRSDIKNIWPITWTGITPPNFAIDVLEHDVNDDDIEAVHQKVVEMDDLLKRVLTDRKVRRVWGED